MEKQGIDVSHYQNTIDWHKVAQAGKEFAILKCQYEAQSHRIDETFEYNYAKSGQMALHAAFISSLPVHQWQICRGMPTAF